MDIVKTLITLLIIYHARLRNSCSISHACLFLRRHLKLKCKPYAKGFFCLITRQPRPASPDCTIGTEYSSPLTLTSLCTPCCAVLSGMSLHMSCSQWSHVYHVLVTCYHVDQCVVQYFSVCIYVQHKT